MELNRNQATNKNKSSFLKRLNLPVWGNCDLNVSVLADPSFPVERVSLCFKKTPSSPTEIVAYLFYLCFCLVPTPGESTNPVMWLCSVVLIAVMEAGCRG